MKTLTIKDMPVNEEIDSNDMAAIEGGMRKAFGILAPLPVPTDIDPPSEWNGFILPND